MKCNKSWSKVEPSHAYRRSIVVRLITLVAKRRRKGGRLRRWKTYIFVGDHYRILNIIWETIKVKDFASNFFVDSAIQVVQNEFDQPVTFRINVELESLVPFRLGIIGNVFGLH